ncbi:hypothetical protein CTAYLR_008649 [Chrysophaeum taylorii]|uniref:Transcription factor IIIC subunit 5 HTH domain-containing protein n=1 Tax=Chrysophaeum taylorii TaxID=2483200 RepID=A0AAD7XGU9_9STRA|nr:hypothetical protein CTAYLR_008649 [Chrysophaeum taylorii]
MGDFLLLELPLAVAETEEAREEALSMVGGIEAVDRAATGDTKAPELKLSLCPDDAQSPPIAGEVSTGGQPRYVVALRVSRRRRRVVDGEVLGRVRSRCHFWNSIADFRGSASMPRYSRIDRASDVDAGAYKYAEWIDSRGRASTGAALRVRHGEPVPREPTPTARLAQSALDDDRVKKELDAIRDLFSRRPAWRRKKLAEVLDARHDDPDGGLSAVELSAVLPMVAFEVVTGPWRRTWVRFGHDLKADPRSRFLQVVDVHKAISGGGGGGGGGGPKKKARPSATMQLCDLESRAAQDAVLNAPRLRTCDAHTGWFSRAFFDDTLKRARDDNSVDQDPLAWREFLDVAAVADLQTTLLPDKPDKASRKRPRVPRQEDEEEDEEEEDDDDDDEEEEEEDEQPQEEDRPRRPEPPPVAFDDAAQANTAFHILEEEDEEEEEEEDDDDDDDDDDDENGGGDDD